jgi:DNA-binding GntR family transcriptional regulator
MSESIPNDKIRVERVSIVDRVVERLRALMLSGDLSPGMPLREASLTSFLGVSRSTLREAERRLVAEGVLRHKAHFGVTVAAPTVCDVREVFEVRRLIECAAVPRVDGQTSAEFHSLAAQLLTAYEARDWSLVVDLDLKFHRSLVGATRNSRLMAFFSNMLAELRLALFLVPPQQSRRISLEDHLELCELLGEGKRRASTALLRRHLDESELEVVEALSAVVS